MDVHAERVAAFRRLHGSGCFVMPNPWDAGSAIALQGLGFPALAERYPGIKEKVLGSCALTVNLDYVDVEEEVGKGEGGLVVRAGDEVAIIPPVSSG